MASKKATPKKKAASVSDAVTRRYKAVDLGGGKKGVQDKVTGALVGRKAGQMPQYLNQKTAVSRGYSDLKMVQKEQARKKR